MFGDYIDLVLQDYTQKKENNKLAIALIHLKPAGLRDLCLELYTKKYDRKKDELAVYGFFGQHEDKGTMVKTIKNFDASKFKPLINYLKKETNKTDEKNIELLAWLIDFELRPFELSKNYRIEEDVVAPVITEGGNTPAEDNDPIVNPDHGETKESPVSEESPSTKPLDRSRFKKAVLYSGILIFITAGIYILYNSNKSTSDTPPIMGKTLNGPEACMYWTGDHYEQVSCQDKKDGLVIALDSFKLQHFRKITRPDTITQNHVGRVWYIKNGGDIEFYTTDGMHPVEIKKRLKPATAYIIDKYILSRTN